MTADELIDQNKATIDLKRLELIENINLISKCDCAEDYRQITLLTGKLTSEMEKLFSENNILKAFK